MGVSDKVSMDLPGEEGVFGASAVFSGMVVSDGVSMDLLVDVLAGGGDFCARAILRA